MQKMIFFLNFDCRKIHGIFYNQNSFLNFDCRKHREFFLIIEKRDTAKES